MQSGNSVHISKQTNIPPHDEQAGHSKAHDDTSGLVLDDVDAISLHRKESGPVLEEDVTTEKLVSLWG